VSIFGSLRNSVNTFNVLSQAVEVSQNNIANASSPGYVKQRLPLYARPFSPGSLLGGVAAGELQSTRDDYAERSVRQQVEKYGEFFREKTLLSDLEHLFDVSGKAGISTGFSQLFSSFSAWSVTPNDSSARKNVITAAQQFAAEFNNTAAAIAKQAVSVERQTRSTVDEINRLVGIVRDLNVARRDLDTNDPGLEAQVYTALEQISQLVNYSASVEPDGTISLAIGGQFPLLLGDRQTKLSVKHYHQSDPDHPAAMPAAHIQAGETDLTGMVAGGELAALLSFRNETVPRLIGGRDTVGEINTLAIAFADRVNQISTSAGGPAIFAYDTADPTRAASTISFSGLTASDLVAAGTSANSVPLSLAQLATSQSPADKIDGVNYTEFFAQTVSFVGAQASQATQAASTQADIVAQARELRARVSGVSLDEEAVQLVEFQRAYEAMARMTNVLNEMTQTILTIVR
jgi:flagellar hook-associated protein 1 FlgK